MTKRLTKPVLFSLLAGVVSFIASSTFLLAPPLVAQEREDVPTVDVVYPAFTFKQEPCVFTAAHFRNLRTYFFNSARAKESVSLRQGTYESKVVPPSGGPASVRLGEVQAPLKGSQIAIVSYSWEWIGGSSSQSDVVQVFGCKDDHLTVLQQISNDAHSQHAGADFDPHSGVLKVRSVRYGAGAHCCPEKLDIVEFQWTGTKFKQLKWKTVPMPK